MAATTDSQIVDNLQAAIAQKEAECDREVEQVRARYAQQIQSLRATIVLFEGQSSNGNGHSSNGHSPSDMRPLLPSVGEDRIELVRHYLRQHGSLRQADIARLSGINSGSVSVALRHLKASKEVKPGQKKHGSQTWVYTA